jgi:hypothetical protein
MTSFQLLCAIALVATASSTGTHYLDGNGDSVPFTVCGADEYESFAGNARYDRQCQLKLCTCENGVPGTGAACPTHGTAKCVSCDGARHLENSDTTCELNTCHCDNGTPATTASGHCTAHNANLCSDCDANYHFMFSTGLVALADDGYSPDVLPLGNCKGDCDRDDHCAQGYVCYHNNYHTVIPGCSGAPKEAMDYCVKATDECEAHSECDESTHFESFAGTSKLDRECTPLTTCQPGTYVLTPKTATSDRDCAPCPANMFSTTTNAASCSAHKSCTLGEYETQSKSATRNRACAKCVPGTYSDYNNALSCIACNHAATYTHQPLEGQASCKTHEKCPAGQQLVDYSDTDAGTCTACDAGKFKSSHGATAYSTCTPCYRGHFSASGATTCTRCAAGTYQSQFGQDTCAACPKGRFVESTGSTALGRCDYCPSGKYADTVGTVHCTACDKGHMGAVAINNNHASHCVACEEGRYQEEDGSTHCAECASGTYAPTEAHPGCLSCDVKNGQYTGGKIDDNTFYWTEGKAGATSCKKHPRDCKPNDYVGAWNTCDKSCGGGLQQETRTPMWEEWGGGTECSAFEWSREQDCNEDPCPIDCVWGEWGSWEYGVNGCSKPCGGGINSRSRAVKTPLKNGGRECVGSKDDIPECNILNCPIDCVLSSWGGWSHDGTLSGSMCTASCNGGRQTRTRKIVTEGDYGGKSCNDYAFSQAQDCETQCCKGFFHNRNNNQVCEQCSAGTFAPQEGVPICTSCDVGTYQPDQGKHACVACPKGRHNTGTGATSLETHCVACAKGKFAEADGAEHCTACIEGKFNANEASNSQDSCNNCAVGQFAENTGSHMCEDCAVGQYNDEDSTTASSSCKNCAAGRFNNYPGRATEGYCRFCPCGQWSVAGSSVCAHCSRGKFRSCPDGEAQCDGGSSEAACTSADAGFHAHTTGLCAQTKCSPGKYMASTSSHFCSSCAPGKYSAANGAASEATCISCPTGQWSSASSSVCTACPVGKFNAYEQKGSVDYCLDCDAGSYAPDTSSASCTLCEAGRFQITPGQTSCELCGSGTSNPSKGEKTAAACVDCIKGYYQPGTGAASCKSCDAGTYQNEHGADACIECTAGTFNMFPAQTHTAACVKCSPGSYSANNKATTCTECPTGRASADTGADAATHCIHCAAGQFADSKGMSVCKQCTKGKYGISTESGAIDGSMHCLKCAKGQFQKYDGATTCEACAADTYTPPHAQGHHMRSCIACAVIDSVRRYSTFGVAGADHCDPVPVDCTPSPWGAVANWNKKQHLDLAAPDNAPAGWTADTWSQCTKSCGGGRHTHTRHPLRMPAAGATCGLADQSQCDQAWGGGKECSHPDFAWSESDDCNEANCPFDCTVTQWGLWEPCSKACDSGGTHRVRAVVERERDGGKKCPDVRDPPVGLKPCNEHSCSEHPAACGAEHVRCDVLMLEHHKSNIGVRTDLTACGHSSVEEQNTCWNNDSCKTCTSPLLVNSNEDHCNKEACHEADTDSERALHQRLESQYNACLNGADTARNAARIAAGLPAIPCKKLFPTLQVTHDRDNMDQLGKFKCAKTSATTCACKCDRHPPCCATRNKLLTNEMVFGNRFTDVKVLQDCCNMCTNHPECTAWEYTSEQVCILKSGVVSASSYMSNPLPQKITTWAGTPSGVGTC